MTLGLLALVCTAALLGPAVSNATGARVPVVIVEMAVGLALGTTGLRILDPHEPVFSFLAEVGFALVMFVAGTHVPLRGPELRRGARVWAGRAVLVGVLAVPAGFGLAALFGTGHGALYAVLLASSSAAIALPTLATLGVDSTRVPTLVAQVALADAVTIVTLPLVLQPDRFLRSGAAGLSVLAAGVALFFLLRRAWRSGLWRAAHRVSERRGYALELRIGLAVLFAIGALASVQGISVMLAGFSAGLAVSAVHEPRRLARQVFGMTEGFLGPLFFVWLGALLDVRAMFAEPRTLGWGLVLGASALAVHTVGGLLTRQGAEAAIVTAAQSGLPVAAVAIGMRIGVLGPAESAAIMLGALITVIASSIAAGRLAARVSSPT